MPGIENGAAFFFRTIKRKTARNNLILSFFGSNRNLQNTQ